MWVYTCEYTFQLQMVIWDMSIKLLAPEALILTNHFSLVVGALPPPASIFGANSYNLFEQFSQVKLDGRTGHLKTANIFISTPCDRSAVSHIILNLSRYTLTTFTIFKASMNGTSGYTLLPEETGNGKFKMTASKCEIQLARCSSC